VKPEELAPTPDRAARNRPNDLTPSNEDTKQSGFNLVRSFASARDTTPDFRHSTVIPPG